MNLDWMMFVVWMGLALSMIGVGLYRIVKVLCQ